LIDGNVSTISVKNPSPIISSAYVNKIPMKIMFDSGATTSFINKAALKRTKHQLIDSNSKQYLMAAGSTTFDIFGTVNILIEFCNIETSIRVGIANSWLRKVSSKLRKLQIWS
jgi:hypothetical protein